MLQTTADVFSGRPNPTWIVSDDQEIRAALRDAAKVSAASISAASESGGRGELRGFYLNAANDELAADHGISSSLYVPLGSGGGSGTSRELAERLINLASDQGVAAGALADGVEESNVINHEMLRGLLTQKLGKETGVSSPNSNAAAESEAAAELERAAPAVTCWVEYAAYYPGFWNNDPNIRAPNNCYNYASNKRTDTFAQPGRSSGHINTAITCTAV
ncbi:hypothetical protein AB3X96_42075 [Paraburkholderia sp. BR13439]|uniref:hypothetical protein n=1 Tax=unclassified Paraburkholderia TaxID=2615204 RepID=UPI0034CE813D